MRRSRRKREKGTHRARHRRRRRRIIHLTGIFFGFGGWEVGGVMGEVIDCLGKDRVEHF